MINFAIIVLLSIGVLEAGDFLWPSESTYRYGEYYISTRLGQMIGLNAIPLAIAAFSSRKNGKEAFLGTWLKVFCFVAGCYLYSVYQGHIDSVENSNSEVFEEVEVKRIPENPHLFVSDEYGFGIIFPNGDPEEMQGEGMGTQGVRYQFFDEKEENPTVYSITAISGPGVPEGLEAGHILSSTADMWLNVDKAESYKGTKKFMKWGERNVLFYDSHFPEGEARLPKRSMLLMREADGVMFILSVVSGVRNELDEKLQGFASTLVLLKQ